ncbi:hypothetical protein [Rhizobium leguminosarum]|uniref:hypothetical protein n=1 Tax=Rhizobium leguminosarum TaxID=384 RepID=UPI0013BC4944|nr:hypothetical protein [Rhizobium leguminosarum]NEI60936.1 hypothetical protein [Rhizobium leguminosarum]
MERGFDDTRVTISAGGTSVETTIGALEAIGNGRSIDVPASPVARVDASNLAATIDRARSLFSEGDYQNALWLSEAVYDQSKAAASYAKRMKLSDELIGKARRMQGDALLIETRAKMALADQFDEAQKAGVVATPGRPKKVSDENLFRLEDVGLSKGQVHEARKLRDAETKEPGLVARAIAARIEAGLEPSRANLRAAVGTASATKEERGDNFYQTPVVATRTLLAFESSSGTIWEPSVGLGAISAVLEAEGYEVVISDLVDRATVTQHGELQGVGDFLSSQPDAPGDGHDIVSNPPYGEVLNDYVAHALRVHKPRKMALLLNLNFLCGFEDDDRNFAMDENPPARVYVFKRRLPMMHREGWDGKKASSRMNTAWFVWERQEDGSYGDTTIVKRVDWKEYEDADALQPGEGGNASGVHFDEFKRETPRKTLDERISENEAQALIWCAEQTDFDAIELRRAIGVRPSTADGLIHWMLEKRLADPAGDVRFKISESGWLALQATAGVLVANDAARRAAI